MAIDDQHFTHSTLRERIVEHVFVGDILRTLMKEKLRYPLTIFINVDSDQTHSESCPETIAEQTVCFAVRLEGGGASVRAEECGG